jgi:hypothetical protein
MSGLEEIDKMKSSTEVTEGTVAGAAAVAATVAQVGATSSRAVCATSTSWSSVTRGGPQVRHLTISPDQPQHQRS